MIANVEIKKNDSQFEIIQLNDENMKKLQYFEKMKNQKKIHESLIDDHDSKK